MLPSWLRAIFSFCAAVAMADVTAVAVASLLSPALSPGRTDIEGVKIVAGLGAVIAFPIIVTIGLVMIFVSRSLGRFDHWGLWALAGCIGAIPGVILFEGWRKPTASVVLWIVAAAVSGALVFRLVWRAGQQSGTVRSP